MARSVKKPGVYKIINIVTGKFYVGSSALNVHYRWLDHLSQMRVQTHPNIHLLRSFNKHSEQSFQFEVLEYCSAEECITREQFWIDTLGPQYNICIKAGSSLGQKRRKETCNKISLSKIGNQNRTGHSKTTAEREAISTTLKTKYQSGEIVHPMLGKTQSEGSKALMRANRPKTSAARLNAKIDQLDMKGNFITTHDSARLAAKAIGVETRCGIGKIRKAYSDSKYSAYGFKWKLNVLLKSGELLEA